MQTMPAFKTACPLRNELHLEIATVVKVQDKYKEDLLVLALRTNSNDCNL